MSILILWWGKPRLIKFSNMSKIMLLLSGKDGTQIQVFLCGYKEWIQPFQDEYTESEKKGL